MDGGNSPSTTARFTASGLGTTWPSGASHIFVTIPICPDLLRLEQLGEADGLRGRIVRAFFWLLGPR
jgi:hypothetical protein